MAILDHLNTGLTQKKTLRLGLLTEYECMTGVILAAFLLRSVLLSLSNHTQATQYHDHINWRSYQC